VSSGLRIGGVSPLVIARRITELHELVSGIGECWVCRPTAGALHGFDGFALEPPFHILVREGRQVHRVRHVIHTTGRLEPIDTCFVEGLPVTSPTRTIIDLASTEPSDRLTVAVDSALRDLGTSEEFLYRRLVAMRSQGRKGIKRLIKVIEGVEITRGGHSWLEREFLKLVGAAGLPRPAMQQVVGKRQRSLIRVDCRFPGTPVVVELLGYRFHRSVMQMQSDAERANRMVLDGLVPLQFTFVDVVERPTPVLRTITEALMQYR
jgi:hypothetical protein